MWIEKRRCVQSDYRSLYLSNCVKKYDFFVVQGGAYYFFEHVLDKPGTIRNGIQNLSNRIGFQRAIGHGCRFINFESELKKGIFQSYTGKWYHLRDSWDFSFMLYTVKSNFGGKAIKSM